MKHKPTKNTYEQANNFIRVDLKNNILEAWSYDWWQYITIDSVGNVFMQDTSYSSFTSKHQSNVRSILRRLGIRVNVSVYNCKESHFGHGINSVLTDEIAAIEKWNENLLAETKVKGSWKKTNKSRLEKIVMNEYRIKDLINYRDNYVDKKVIPSKASKQPHEERGLEKYFTKPNGVIDVNGMKSIAQRMGYGDAPESIDNIKNLLGLNNNSCIDSILIYEFSNDLNNMIPDVDSVEYQKLLKAIKRYKLDVKNMSTHCLDKLHTFLTNLQNARTYEPKPAVEFELSKEVLALTDKVPSKELTIIRTDKQLRSEGRKQNHCIGSSDYISQCMQGYQALNYKGYTFFLTPDNKIDQTQGKHNCSTPWEYREELETLLAA